MAQLTEFAKENLHARYTYELARAIRGEKCSEELFETVSAEDFADAFFDAVASTDSVNESSKNIIDCIRDAQNGAGVDESIIGGVLGTIAGAAFGPKIGQAVCSVLGLAKGPLYDLMTSRIVTTAIALKLGLRI